jgi:hypothetical protein
MPASSESRRWICDRYSACRVSARRIAHFIPFWITVEAQSAGPAGGVLERIDSLCFAAPVFFHLTRYFDTP